MKPRARGGLAVNLSTKPLDPFVAGFDDFLPSSTGAHFKDEEHFFRKQSEEFLIFHVACEWGHVVVTRPCGIMKVATDEPRGDGFHPFYVIKKPEVMFDLNMTEVMPVADMGKVKFVEDVDHFVLAGNFFKAMPTFDAEVDIFVGGVVDDFG